MAHGQFRNNNHTPEMIPARLAGFLVFGVEVMPRDMLARSVGYTNPGSAAFVRAMQALRSDGSIAVAGNRVSLAERGIRATAALIQPPRDNGESLVHIQELIRLLIPGRGDGAARILAFLRKLAQHANLPTLDPRA